MGSNHTIESPLKLTWTGSGYKVNKPSQENQELVSLDYAVTIIEQNRKLLNELKDVHCALIMCNNPNDKKIIESIEQTLKETEYGK